MASNPARKFDGPQFRSDFLNEYASYYDRFVNWKRAQQENYHVLTIGLDVVDEAREYVKENLLRGHWSYRYRPEPPGRTAQAMLFAFEDDTDAIEFKLRFG